MNAATQDTLCWIDGEWSVPTVPMGQWNYDPNDGSQGEVQRSADAAAIERALAAAERVHADGEWRAATIDERARALETLAGELEARQPALARADAAATGVVIASTKRLAALVPRVFAAAAAQSRESCVPQSLMGEGGEVRVERLPWGPALVIVPWNAPAVIAAHKAASALAAGCPVIMKPSEFAPQSCTLLAKAVEAADLPRGVFQLLQGGAAVGESLVADPRVRAVSFTGGTTGGAAVAAACGRGIKPVQLELGGNNPLIVLEDADLEEAADGVVRALTTLNGQWCRALGRLLVHERVREPLLAAVQARLASLRVGHSLDDRSEMGPLIHEGHRQLLRRKVQTFVKRGGRVLESTALPSTGGWFLPPLLVTGVQAEDACEEIFGPVATVHSFANDAEAVGLANGTPYGLAAYVFGGEHHAWSVAAKVEAGAVKINGVTLTALHPAAPRAAWGQSGLGDEGVQATLEFFCGRRVVGNALQH